MKNNHSAKFVWVPITAASMVVAFVAGFLTINYVGQKMMVQSNKVIVATVTPVAEIQSSAPVVKKSTGKVIKQTQTGSVESYNESVLALVKPKAASAIATRGFVAPDKIAIKSKSVNVIEPKSVPKTSVPKSVSERIDDFLAHGHRLEQSGDIAEARIRFRQAFALGASVAALAIGRSYDPRFSVNTAQDNDHSDARLAHKWYEEWYVLGVKNNQISARIRFDRLIKGLKRG